MTNPDLSDLLSYYSASYHKRPKAIRQQYFAHNFVCKKDKDNKSGTSVLQLFFLYFLKFYTKILILSTLKFLSVCFIRVFQFSIFGTALNLESSGKTQTRHRTFYQKTFSILYLLKSPYI